MTNRRIMEKYERSVMLGLTGSANLYRTKSAPENLATHWATSPFYLSHWMLIRRPSNQRSRAFVVSLCGSLPACHATCSNLHLAAAGMTRGHAPPAAAHGTRLSPHRHPPNRILCSTQSGTVDIKSPPPPSSRWFNLLKRVVVVAYKIKEYCMQLLLLFDI